MIANWDNPATWSVLVVDDEADNRSVVEMGLEFFGAKVKVARNGFEGLEILETFKPSFIMLDLSMPRMDGWEMHQRIKADSTLRGVPVIAFTAHALPMDKERVEAEGFEGYITKPVQLTTLQDDLQSILKGLDMPGDDDDAGAVPPRGAAEPAAPKGATGVAGSRSDAAQHADTRDLARPAAPRADNVTNEQSDRNTTDS